MRRDHRTPHARSKHLGGGEVWQVGEVSGRPTHDPYVQSKIERLLSCSRVHRGFKRF